MVGKPELEAQVSISKLDGHMTANSASLFYIKDADMLYKLVTLEKHPEHHQLPDWTPICME
jgi:hypothetical protein